MSVERGFEGVDSETEIYIQELKDYLNDASIGSEKYQAFSDFYSLNFLRWSQERLTGVIEEEMDEDMERRRASSLRITEFRIALLEHDMEQKKTRLPGYGASLAKIEDLYEIIAIGVFETAADEYPGEDTKIESYGDELLQRALKNVNNSLDEKH